MTTRHRGTFTVLITPFTPDGSRVDEDRLRQLVEFQVSEGIHGLVPLGSTGEFLSMTDAERAQVARIVLQPSRRPGSRYLLVPPLNRPMTLCVIPKTQSAPGRTGS